MVSCSGSLVPSPCGEGGALLSPSTLLRLPAALLWNVPCVACGSSFRVLHDSADSVVPAFGAFPGPSSSGSQELDGHTLPGCGAPSLLRCTSLSFHPCQSGACAFSSPRPQPQFPPTAVGCVHLELSCDPPGGCQPSRISGSLWLETGSLFAVW